MTLYILFWVILVAAVIGFVFWYLKSRGKKSIAETTISEEPKERSSETPPPENSKEE